MTDDPEDALEPTALSGQADDETQPLNDAAFEDEALDDAAQGVSATSDAIADGTDETGEETGEIDAIGRAAGLVVRDDKPFRGIDEVERRDQHRWELDPASAELPAGQS